MYKVERDETYYGWLELAFGAAVILFQVVQLINGEPKIPAVAMIIWAVFIIFVRYFFGVAVWVVEAIAVSVPLLSIAASREYPVNAFTALVWGLLIYAYISRAKIAYRKEAEDELPPTA